MANRPVREVMTKEAVMMDERSTIGEAARRMFEEKIGDVLIGNDGEVDGIVTDRDIVIRAVAKGADPEETPIGDIASSPVITVDVSDDIESARSLMRSSDIRRLPVLDGGKAVGFVSLGDLAEHDEPTQATLDDISSAPAND